MKKIILSRWVLLIVLLTSILFNYTADRLLGHSPAEVTALYPSLLVPAAYAFSIWGLIYLGLLVYAVQQLRPLSYRQHVYNRINAPLLGSLVLSMVWGTVFRLGFISLSMWALFSTLVAVYIVYIRAHKAVTEIGYNALLLLPFSIYAAWLSAANIAGFTVWLLASSITPSDMAYTALIMLLLSVCGIMLYYFRDRVYLAVVIWALAAIYNNTQLKTEGLKIVLLTAIGLLGAALVLSLFVYRRKSAVLDHS